LSRLIDVINTSIGRWLSWLIVVAVLISAANAIVRKVFDLSSNAFLEMQWVLFSIVFLMCSPWTLLSNEHIRIDIVNHSLPLKVRGWIDMVGHVFFLMPFMTILLYTSIPFFLASFHQNEQSFSAGGLPQWPAKSLIMIACVVMIAQGISEIIKRAAIMRGLMPDPNAKIVNAAEQEAERLVMNIAGENISNEKI
jgi:TRAP-type mannitol/chloroaromatic compound transport system permease small subunit